MQSAGGGTGSETGTYLLCVVLLTGPELLIDIAIHFLSQGDGLAQWLDLL